jgi:tRNA pseudouridine-54 N-methylase
MTVVSGPPDSIASITFPGETLRRVSPDERSISFFLLKAKAALDELHAAPMRTLDNGIIVRMVDLDTLLMEWKASNVYIASEGANEDEELSLRCDGIFIYEVKSNLFSERFHSKNIWNLPKPPHPERFILEINLICDSQR